MAVTVARVSSPSFFSSCPNSFWWGTLWTKCSTLHIACTLRQPSLTRLKPTILHPLVPSMVPLLTNHGAPSVPSLIPAKTEAFLTCSSIVWGWDLPYLLYHLILLSSSLLLVTVTLSQHTYSLSHAHSVCSCCVSGSKHSPLFQLSFTVSTVCILPCTTSTYVVFFGYDHVGMNKSTVFIWYDLITANFTCYLTFGYFLLRKCHFRENAIRYS